MAYRSLPDNKKHRSLSEKLNAEIGGNYGNFMQYLAMSRPVFNGQSILQIFISFFQISLSDLLFFLLLLLLLINYFLSIYASKGNGWPWL